MTTKQIIIIIINNNNTINNNMQCYSRASVVGTTMVGCQKSCFYFNEVAKVTCELLG